MFTRKPRFAKEGFVGGIPKRVSLKIFVLSTGYIILTSPQIFLRFLVKDLDITFGVRIFVE